MVLEGFDRSNHQAHVPGQHQIQSLQALPGIVLAGSSAS